MMRKKLIFRQLNKCKSHLGTWSGVWMSKRLLLTSRSRCKCPMEIWNKLITSKTVIRSSSVTRSRFSEMSDQWRLSLYTIMSQNFMLHLGEGDFIMFAAFFISTIELPEGRLQTFPDIHIHVACILARKAYVKVAPLSE